MVIIAKEQRTQENDNLVYKRSKSIAVKLISS